MHAGSWHRSELCSGNNPDTARRRQHRQNKHQQETSSREKGLKKGQKEHGHHRDTRAHRGRRRAETAVEVLAEHISRTPVREDPALIEQDHPVLRAAEPDDLLNGLHIVPDTVLE